MRILDLGCGAKKFKGDKDDVVVGVDFVDTYNPDVLHDLSDEPYPFDDNSFDNIIASEVIEHLTNPEVLIRESRRILRKGGLLILTTNNKKSLINRIFKSYHTLNHLSLFDIPSLKKLVSKYFLIEELNCSPYQSIFHAHKGKQVKYTAATLRRILHYFLPMSLQERIVIVAKKA